MSSKAVRLLIGLLTAFIALTAIGGGIAMLTQVDRFPLEWLHDTPFTDYTLPALTLAMVVGGSSLIATVTIFGNRSVAPVIAAAAGILIMGFILVEVAILKQTPAGPTPIELFYLGTGLIVTVLSVLWRRRMLAQAAQS